MSMLLQAASATTVAAAMAGTVMRTMILDCLCLYIAIASVLIAAPHRDRRAGN